MDAKDRIIHGAFSNTDEVIAEIRKLNQEGYSKEHITVYSNNPDLKSYDAIQGKPRKEKGSFDITNENSKERSKEGAFDVTDKNSQKRSSDGSFDRVDENPKAEKKEKSADDDRSIWESVKDFFTSDTYDYEGATDNPDYNKDDDLLYPYKDTLNNGGHIIMLNNTNMDNPPGGF